MANRSGSNYCQHLNTIPVSANKIRLHKCKNCDDSIYGVGSCVKCNDYPHYFHQICVKPDQKLITHPFNPSVRFEFCSSPDNNQRRRCVACHQSNITGYHYVGDNQTYIHPYCLVSLKDSAKNATINLHKKALDELVDTTNLEMDCGMGLSKNVKCIICKEKDTQGREFGWVYKYSYQSDEKFECHIACLRNKLIGYGLNEMCVVKKNPAETSRASYFLELPMANWERLLLTITGLTIPVVVAGLDMMISAFVGVPVFSIFLSTGLGLRESKSKNKVKVKFIVGIVLFQNKVWRDVEFIIRM